MRKFNLAIILSAQLIGFCLSAAAINLEGAEDARDYREQKERAMLELGAKIRRVDANIKSVNLAVAKDLKAQPMDIRSSECRVFAEETRFRAAPLHARIIDLVAKISKTVEPRKNVQTLVEKIDDLIRQEVQISRRDFVRSYIRYAQSVPRAQFASVFSPDTCTMRVLKAGEVAMTDSVAGSSLGILELELRNLEIAIAE